MRPERIEMEGFAPFRRRTSVDLAGLELFALTGPTGAGKSSVIDALVFALYGEVPRHDRRMVEPIISLGMAEARILVEFTLGGDRYTVARVVRRRRGGGATTPEARLDRDGRNLASGAGEVTAAVTDLLGLNVTHFTRSVVLPQGQFAAFLHDRPSGQQELVKALLDLEVLDGIRERARDRAKAAEIHREAAEARLLALVGYDEEAEEQAAARVEQLTALAVEVEELEAALREEETLLAKARHDLEAATLLEDRLAQVKPPEGVSDLASRAAAAKEAADQVAATLARLLKEEDEALAAQAALPTLDRLARIADAEGRLQAELATRDASDPAQLDPAREEAESRLRQAREALAEAEAHHQAVRRAHAAHDLVAGLEAGDPCPVCGRALPADPAPPPSALAEADDLLAQARRAQEEAREALGSLEVEQALLKERHAQATEAIAALEAELVSAPSSDERRRLEAARRTADEAVAEIRRQLGEARAEQADAQAVLEAVTAEVARSRDELSALRDGLAEAGPPSLSGLDLGEAWARFLEWAATARAETNDRLAAARLAVAQGEERVAEGRRRLHALLEEADVDGTGPPVARVAAATAAATAHLEQVRERRRERRQLDEEIATRREAAEVAKALERHLRADRFEGWLLAEALERLVAGANQLLGELTDGAYSLAWEERDLAIVDHRNADEKRSVRSLSGGETFLVSLALALALGDELTSLSERGAAKLEAVFLDEGFGSLDAETLETVAQVVVELSTRGRLVGLVTHVKELAANVPIRFEVRPGPGGSSIERVET